MIEYPDPKIVMLPPVDPELHAELERKVAEDHEQSQKQRVQHIPYSPPEGRVETGAVQFGDDWPAFLVRGDEAMYILMQIRAIKAILEKDYPEAAAALWLPLTTLNGYAKIIAGDVIVGGCSLPEDKPE